MEKIVKNSYLSKKGFVIKKEFLTLDELNKLKIELRARPLIDSKFVFPGSKVQDNSYPVFIETKNKIYIPKMFGINKFGLPPATLSNYNGKEWNKDIIFNGSLYDRQITPVNTVISACKEKGGGILNAETGSGKSIMLLKILSELKGKAIIIVNKIPLMNQWISEIKTFLPNAKIGTIQGQKNVDVNDKDIIVCMLQSMSRIEYPDSYFEDISVTVIDEVHNISSESFSKILFKLASKYTIGLSATPNRSDGCEYVFKWHLGDIVYKSTAGKREGKPPIIRIIKIDTNEYKEVCTENKFTGQKQIQFTSMLSELIQMSKRNLLIIELIKTMIIEKRKILVLSDRRNHLGEIKKLLDNDTSVSFTYGLFLGAMKQKDLEKSRKCDLIIATYSAFGEGVSEKELDTLILCSPKKFVGHIKTSVKQESGKLEQIVGRVFRKDHIDKNPIIIDLQDNFSVYKSQAASRKVFYKQHFTNGIFEDQSINLDEHTDVKIEYIKTKSKKDEKIKELEKNILTKCCILED
jgi:superfamily II DNA or RNA helicase